MKKTLTFLSVLLLLITNSLMAQTQTNTQFPNPGFEYWVEHTGASTCAGTNPKFVPYNWHTFDEASSVVDIGDATKNHHNYHTSGGHSGKYIGILCRKAIGTLWIPANGALSTGRTRIGSTSAGNSNNYNYTDLTNSSDYSASHKCSWEFVGCPDSMSFYYKTSYTGQQPLFKVFLHKGLNDFRDRADGTLWSGDDTYLIGSSVDTFSTSSSWKREVYPFTYSRPGQGGNTYSFLGQTSTQNATYGYYTNLNRPDYMLASFSTSKTAGTGNNNDELSLDDLWCIYDKGLASVSIGGTANNTAKNYFNGQEFLTHEPTRTYDANGNPSFNNSGSATWNDPTPIACNNIPQVAAMPKSKLITDFQITQATAANGYKATIYVKHNDNSTFYYYIQFAPNTPTVSVSSSASGSVCPGTSVTLTASGANSYAWSNGSTGSTITVQASNRTYTVTGTTSGCTGTASASVSVVNTTAPTITSSNPTSYCGSGSSTFTAQGTGRNPELHWYSNGTEVASGVNASYNATWNTPGTYVITCKQYTDPCLSEPATATVTVYDALVTPVVEDQTRCGAGTVTFTVSNPVEGQTYTWKSMTGSVLGTGTSFTTPSLTTNTNYKVQASNPACGAGSDVVVSAIIVNTTLTINSVTSDQTICPNQAIYLSISSTPSSGASLSWDWSPDEGILSGDESSSIRVLPETTTTYTVQVTATNTVNGVTCTASESRNVTVTVNTPVAGTTTITGPTSICEGESTTLTANTTGNVGGMSYQWSPATTLNATTGASVIATPTSNTTYHVTATATNVVNGVSCTATSSSSIIYTVNVTPMPTITAPANKDQTVCAGGQIESIQFICSDNCTVTESNLPAGLNFNSNIGLITGRPTESGTYTITVSNDCGSVTASGTITVNAPAVTLQDLNIAPACEGGTINLAATPSGTPTGTVTYHWSGPNSFTSDEQNPQIDNVTSVNAGSYYVTATATNVVNGVSCTATSTKSTIVSVSTPHIELADLEDTTVCAGNYLNLSATKVGSSAGTVTYQWSGPNGFTSSNYYFYRNNMTAADAGVYTVTATATSGVCTVTDIKSANVTVLSPAITLEDLTAQTVCSGTTLSLSATPSGTPSGTVTYSWSGPGNFTSTQQNPQISNVTSANAGRYYVTATATDGSCTATSVKSVINTVNTVSVGTINLSNQEVTICKEQGRATLSVSCSGGSGTRTYAWSPADGLSTTSESTTYANPQTTTTYTVTITATNTVNDVVCTASETREFTVAVNAPAVTLGDITAQSVCAGTTLNLSASPSGTTTGTVTYSWSGPNSFTSTLQNPQITNVTSANAGTYHVTATATNVVNGVSCTATSSKIANVQVKELPYITEPDNKNQTVCAGRAISSITFSHGTGTMSVSNLPAGLNFNSTIGLISGTPTQSGTYTVTLTNDCGTVTASGTITVNAPSVTLENIANQTVCAGSALNLSATPTSTPVGTVTYAWTGPNGFTSNEQNIHIDNVTTNHAGNYSVTATATVGSCTVTSTKGSSITINNPSVTLQDIASQTLCAGENLHLHAATSGTSVGTVSYAWSGPAGFTDSGTDMYRNNMTTAYAGTYTVTATATRNLSGTICTATDTKSVQVTVNAPVAGTLNVVGNTTICAGNSTTLTASITGNTGTMAYAWSPATGLDATSGAQVTANPTATTTYTVTATATVGTCTTSTTKQVTVTVNQIPTVAITGNTTFCQGNTETLSATSGYAQYLWSNGSRNASIDVTTSGSYSVTVTNNSGCQNNASVTVTVLPVPATPTATSVNNTSCASPNGSITVTAPTGSNYTYSIGGAFQSATTFSNLSAGNYTLTVKNSSGCTSTTEVEVGATGNSVNATATANTPCAGDMLQLTGASTTTGVTYAWTGPNSFTSTQQNPQISNATSANAGTYTLTVTETATNCTKIATVNVTVNALPTVTVSGATTICAGTTANLTAQGANTYVWSNNEETATVSIANAGTYTVEGTDVNGCKNTAEVTVTVNTPSVALNAMTDVDVCEGGNVALNATLNGTATGTVTYAWTGPNSYTSAQQNPQLNGVTTAQSGEYTVVATATNEVNGVTCTATDSKTVNVTVNALPAAPVLTTVNNTSCATPNGSITVTSPTGANYQYAINGGDYQTSTIFENLDAGNFTVSVKDVNTGCMNENSVRVTTQGSTLEVEIAVNEVCAGGTAAFQSTLTNATGDVTYAWTGPAGFTSAAENPTINNVQSRNAGTYTLQVTETATSCRVSATTTLVVNEPTTGDTSAVACVSFDWYEHTGLTTSGDYTHVFVGGNANGCDSTVTLHLTINKPTVGDTTAVACVSYDWYEHTGLTTSGDYTHVFEGGNANGCDSTVTLHLTINTPTTGDTTAVACDSFDWYEHTGLTTSGDYTHVFVGGNANGCDSTVTLHLTINKTPVVTVSGELSIINGNSTTLTASGADSYKWNTNETTASITVSPTVNTEYSVVGTTNGCTSAPVSVTVIVNECVPGHGDTTAVACEEFTWYGTTYTESTETAMHVFEGVMPDGCDSIVTLHLTINHAVASSMTATECGSFTWNGETYTESGEYTHAYAAANGCDSVVTLHLTINQPVTSSSTITACDSYTWNSETYTESGDYTQTFTAANGCDSVVTLHLTINKTPVVTVSGELSIINGNSTTLTASGADTYEWNTEATTASITVAPTENTEYSVVGTTNGCTSAPVNVTVIVNDCVPGSGDTTAVACEEFTWYGTTYTESTETAMHVFEGVMADGCDSIVTLHLTINHAVSSSMTATECGSFTWNGETYTESGEYTHAYAAANGCDSVVTLNLTINQPVTYRMSATACESYTWNGQTYNESGEYTQTFTAANGCDSVVTLDLTVQHAVSETISATACESYTWNTETYDESGEYTQTFTAATGCDSVVTLNLTINQPVNQQIEAVACGSYTWNEETYEVSGEYMQTFTAANGCDSVVTLNLTINQPTEGDTTAVACETFTWYEHAKINESGDYTHTFENGNANGCDSVVTLHLTINHMVTNSIFVTACESYIWNEQTYTESGEYTQTFTAANGCDSVVTLDLTIQPALEETITVTACQSYTWNTQTYTESGEYTQTFTAATGCDSVVTLILTINNEIDEQIEAVACGSYTWNEETYEMSGVYTQTFTAANGCDSVVTLYLTINLPTEGDTTATACGTFDWYEHTGITASGNYTHIFENGNADGCDSVVTLHLTINQPVTNAISATACQSYTWNEQTYNASGEYTQTFTAANGCDSVVTLNLIINQPTEGDTTAVECMTFDWYEHVGLTTSGNYTHVFENANVAGCDSIVTLHLTINTEIHNNLTEHGCDSYEWDGDVYYTSGVYTKSYPLPNGCDSIVTIDLTITPSYHIEIKDTICEGALYAHYNFMETEAGDYTQNLQTANGCDSIVILHLATKECSSDCGTDVQDIDRNVYGTKAVNHLCWMTSNLRTTRYSDATPIPFAVVYSYPYDPNDTANLETYGRLYDWASASRNAAPTRSPHVQGACPFGWRLPSQEEFEEWASAYTMDQLRSTSNWLIENGNNASGLNMQPAGFYNSNTQRCEELHGKAYFYTSDYYGSTQDVVHMVAQCGCWELLFTRDKNLNDAYSVRCVKDIE